MCKQYYITAMTMTRIIFIHLFSVRIIAIMGIGQDRLH